jgi:predicted DNA-binding transcriptional regulator AlpA
MADSFHLPPTGFLRLKQIIGDRKAGIPAIFPISRSGWYQGVKEGRYPSPVKLSERCSAWRVEDIRALLNSMAAEV